MLLILIFNTKVTNVSQCFFISFRNVIGLVDRVRYRSPGRPKSKCYGDFYITILSNVKFFISLNKKKNFKINKKKKKKRKNNINININININKGSPSGYTSGYASGYTSGLIE